jgi:WD40 repeat protein
MRKGCLAYTIFGHNGEVYCCRFSPKGDYFASGGADCNILVRESGFEKKKGEKINSLGICETGHRADKRTVADVPEYMKKTTNVTPTIF